MLTTKKTQNIFSNSTNTKYLSKRKVSLQDVVTSLHIKESIHNTQNALIDQNVEYAVWVFPYCITI